MKVYILVLTKHGVYEPLEVFQTFDLALAKKRLIGSQHVQIEEWAVTGEAKYV